MKSLRSAKPITIKEKRAERKARRTRLKVIRQKINRLGKGFLDDSKLKAAGVNRQPMSLEEKATLPRFFAPYNAKIDPSQDEYVTNFPQFDDLIFEDHAESAQRFLHKFIKHCELPQEDEYPAAPNYEDWGDFGFPDLVEVLGKPSWKLMTAWDMPLRNQPHIKCMLSTDAVAENDRLLYSELVTILEIIKQRLRTRETFHHVDAPVFMYSFIDSSMRVLEGNFDGKKLVVRATQLYDFTHDDQKGYELSAFLAKWWYGDTTNASTQRFRRS